MGMGKWRQLVRGRGGDGTMWFRETGERRGNLRQVEIRLKGVGERILGSERRRSMHWRVWVGSLVPVAATLETLLRLGGADAIDGWMQEREAERTHTGRAVQR